jgi:tRNA threonylcarbamoyladenosine biosynthesis protein TsaE
MSTLLLRDEAATEALGQAITAAPVPLKVYLSGEIGAGKTTLARALLRALGVRGHIKSPTYAVLELYSLGENQAAHLDLYRLSGARELEALGFRELLDASTWLLVEWPERGEGGLPPPDLHIALAADGEGRIATVTGPFAAQLTQWLNKSL